MKEHFNGLIRLVTTGVLLLVVYEQTKTIERMKTVENTQKDSLIVQTKLQQREILKYERALLILDEQDSTASNKVLNILEKEVVNKF